MRTLQAAGLIYILLYFFQVCEAQGQQPVCDQGWFGPRCQYMCHCRSDQCDENGTCTGRDARCQDGWFGPVCQYKDLVRSNEATMLPNNQRIQDGNDSTCQNLQSVSVSWTKPHPFTWLRIHVSDAGMLENIRLGLEDDAGTQRDCINQRKATITSKTMDIHCDLNFLVKKVTLSGQGVLYLCSLYISGGRNVALKENATQSSSYIVGKYDIDYVGADNAVDGNPSENFDDESCTHTGGEDIPHWMLALSLQRLVNRYVIYNRGNNRDRLKGFQLRSYNETMDMEFNYTDRDPEKAKYEIIDSGVSSPVKSVNISLNTVGILTLCEVEVYGDSICTARKFGRECEHDCNCARQEESCFVSTGGCPSGCAAGYHGESCKTECERGWFGVDCNESCSPNCINGSCDNVNGTCEEGCTEGYKLPTCVEQCDSGRYGLSCNETCSPHCSNGTCDLYNGTCDGGCIPGYKPPLCVDECTVGTYGKDCKELCSFYCFSGACDAIDGTCDKGCSQGYQPPMCYDQCDPGFHGYNCTEPCSSNCLNETCNATTGECSPCVPGYQGLQCEKECDPGFYGPDCKEQCSINCLNQQCHHVNGICLDCPKGKEGEMCDKDCDLGSFGHRCNETCSDNCKDKNSCDIKVGSCDQGCKDGYNASKDPQCNKECDPMTFGAECSLSCSANCKVNVTTHPKVCEHVDGQCQLGCLGSYEPPTCTKLIPESDSNVGVIAGPIIVLIILIVAVVVGAFVWRRRKRTKQNNLLDNGSRADITEAGISGPETSKTRRSSSVPKDRKASKDPNGFDPTAAGDTGDEDYYNTSAVPYKTSIAVEDLTNYMLSRNKEFFQQQFAKIPATCNAPQTIGLSAENKQKNRYKNICAYDHNRVLLESDPDKKHGDYLNASYVHGYNDEEKYIASQGPNKVILNDFVRMLWEQKVDKMVMLTNLIEEGKHKCEKYWPDESESEMEFDEIKVRLAATQVFADYTIRRLQLMKVGEPTHSLTHFHFTSWPDKGVPTTPWGLVDFEQRVASYPTDRPIVVHCSAGVGRTGTFIALRKVMREAEDTGCMDFYTTLWKLRQDRVHMIQTAEQYIFLHEAAQVAMVCIGTTVTSDDIAQRITKLESKSGTGQTLMEKEFRSVCNVCADSEDGNDEEGSGGSIASTYVNSRTINNKMKNRFSNILPKEFYRPFLSCETKDMGDYINAVLLPSFTKQNHQILTQLPLPTTVTDFWRLVTQFKVSLVIAFEVDADDSTIGTYLPVSEDEPMHCGSFDIEAQQAVSDSLWEEQELTVTFLRRKKTRLSTSSTHKEEHHLTHLKCKETSLDPEKLLTFIKKTKACRPGEGRTLYMCRNGADYSGLVCVLSLLLDRMDNDHCLTVPLVVGAMKTIRPQVIPTLEQYRLLYQILRFYNDSNSVYCNVGDAKPVNGSPHLEVTNHAFDPNEDTDINVYANS